MTAHAHVSFPADGVGLLLIDNPPENFGSYELLQALMDGLDEIKRGDGGDSWEAYGLER